MAESKRRRIVERSDGISDSDQFLSSWQLVSMRLLKVGRWSFTPDNIQRQLKPAYGNFDYNTWSFRERAFLGWLRWASWGSCSECGVRYPRKLSQAELFNVASALPQTSKKCWQCREGKYTYPTVRASEVPEVLRGLNSEQLRALQIFTLHQGKPKFHKNGFTRKDQLSGLSWKPSTVRIQIEDFSENNGVVNISPVG